MTHAVDTLALLIGVPDAAAGLARCGLPEEEGSVALLRAVGGRAGDPRAGAGFLDRLLPALAASPDPPAALRRLEFWSAHLATPASTLAALREQPRLLADLLHLLAVSPYLCAALAREPGLYALLLGDGEARSLGALAGAVEAALRAAKQLPARRDALRRVRRRETLRIAWRELTGRAAPREASREFSDLADALLAAAARLADEEFAARFTGAAPPPVAVIALGKLGGRELNYSSDVDLLLVSDGPADERSQRAARRWGELFLVSLTEQTGEGTVFRVDLRLRPEGRAGALVRTLASCRVYFDRWVETWERQALIKARAVAGDAELGERFLALAEEVAFARGQSPSVREEVRSMRLAVERRLEAAGELETNVKEGRGGIRDVEFTAQLLQLLFGGERPELRAANTWEALERLQQAGLLEPEEAETLRAGYDFLRSVEHRLQLAEDLPVRTLPADPEERRRLARACGFQNWTGFLAAHRERTRAVRAVADGIYARLGFPGEAAADRLPGLVLALPAPEAAAAVAELLAPRGFQEPPAAVETLRRLALGPADAPHPGATRRAFAEVAGVLVDAAAESPDPDAALRGFELLAEAKRAHRSVYRSYAERPERLAALCRLLGGAPALAGTLARQPELVDVALAAASRAEPPPPAELLGELRQRLAFARGRERRADALRRFKRRELVRVAARDLLREAVPDVPGILAGWADAADACLQGALELALDQARRDDAWPLEDAPGFVVLALGRLGGRELHYASDLDLVYLCQPPQEGPPEYRRYEALARRFHEAIQATTAEGPLFEIDLRLRPEGTKGAFVTHVDTCRAYFADRAETWEKQAWIKARPVAGDLPLGEALLAELQPAIFPETVPEAWRGEVAALKRRVERERCRPEERDRHLKLGPGGLSDVEFAVQWLQLAHGGKRPELRRRGTFRALAALRAAGLLPEAEADALREGYAFQVALRQRLSLRDLSRSADLLPEEARELLPLARGLGLPDAEALRERLAAVRAAIRPVFERILGGT